MNTYPTTEYPPREREEARTQAHGNGMPVVAAPPARHAAPVAAPQRQAPTGTATAAPRRSKADALRIVSRLKRGVVVAAMLGFSAFGLAVGSHLATTSASATSSGTTTTATGTSSGQSTSSSSSTSSGSSSFSSQSSGSNSSSSSTTSPTTSTGVS